MLTFFSQHEISRILNNPMVHVITFIRNRLRSLSRAGLFHFTSSHTISLIIFELFPPTYTGCPRRNGQNFGRVFLMLNYKCTDITQNTYVQSWTVTEIMAIEKCGLLGCPRTVRRPWRHTRPVRMPGNERPLANVAMQWPWWDYASAAAYVKCLVTLRTTMTWVRVFL